MFVVALAEWTALVLTEGEGVAFDFDVGIENVAAAVSGNAIPAVVAPSTNYDLLLRLSDVDIGAGAAGA